MKLTMNTAELAEALGLSHGTIQKMCTTDPEKLPPMMVMPIRRRLWSVEVVQAWVRDHAQLSEVQGVA